MEALGPGDPRRISGYQLEGRLGAGGMGQVYLGRAADGRTVAVKVIRRELVEDPDFVVRFRREIAARMAVSGQHAVPVVGADPDGDPPWLASVYVPAPSLAEAVASRGPLPEDEVLRLAAGLAEALKAIHGVGLTHRDLKPGNILLADDGPRVIDFGLAVSAEHSALTRTNMMIGTPSYMAPERIKNENVGPASDVYSLGAVLAFAATGRSPHGEGSVATMVYRVLSQQPDLTGISGRLLEVITACLAMDPAHRPDPDRILRTIAGDAEPETTAATKKIAPPVPTKQETTSGHRPPAKTSTLRTKVSRGFWALVGIGVVVTIVLFVWHSVRIEYHLFGKDDAARYLGASQSTVTETDRSITAIGNNYAHRHEWNPIGDSDRGIDYSIREYDSADAAGGAITLAEGQSLTQLPNGSNVVLSSSTAKHQCYLQLQNDDLVIEIDFTLGTSSASVCAPARDAARIIDDRLGQFP